ncbi:MAG: two-component regulator propeller domain-containing protein, partial [Daejeonella sp.]|uniref:ligand-binding sensor domain-containing protein n=1 Tax=Daejeonella sp. TaxID=2805397 RepID=UPI003C77D8C1
MLDDFNPEWRHNMGTKCYFLPFILLLILGSSSFAQRKSPFRSVNYTYQTWNNKNGLIQNSVADIVKDENGYLWIATEEGIQRFDGINFKVINEENTAGLYSSTFYDLFKSRQGIWAASLNTVLYVKDDSITSFDFRSHIKSSWISAISEDDKGTLWIGTNLGDLFYLKNQKIVKHAGWPGKGTQSIQVMSKGPKGLLIGTDNGLFQINRDEAVVPVPGLQTQNIRAIALHKDGSLWIGTKDNGLYLLRGGKTLNYTRKEGLNELFIRSIGISPQGEVWLGTSSSGIQVFKDGKFTNVKDNGSSNDGVKCIFFTEPNLIWLGTAASGLIQMKPARIQNILKTDGLADNVILPIYQHRNGEIWIGTAGQGLNRLKDGKIFHYTRGDGLASEIILSIYGTDDKILIGTPEGLNTFNLKTSTFDRKYKVEDGLASNVVQSILEDSKKRIWISTNSGGVHILEDDKIKRMPLIGEISKAELTSIFEDRRKNIWVGSSGAGIVSINPKNEFKYYKNNSGVSSDIVYGFYEDKEGSLWLGTEAGLILHQKKKILNKANGLNFNGIYRIIDDGEGFIWLSGNFGIQRFSVQELLRVKHDNS